MLPDELPDSLEDLDAEEPTSITPSELYAELISCSEIILTIPAEEEDKLRKGLASAKAKLNAKLKDSGLGTDNTVLSFQSSPSTTHEGAVQIVITLAKRSGITVLAKEYPDPEF